MANLAFRFFEAADCKHVTFNDKAACKRLVSYDSSEEYANEDVEKKPCTLLTEYILR
jgi:hypothetical protein